VPVNAIGKVELVLRVGDQLGVQSVRHIGVADRLTFGSSNVHSSSHGMY
jgi:hypothetical protein